MSSFGEFLRFIRMSSIFQIIANHEEEREFVKSCRPLSRTPKSPERRNIPKERKTSFGKKN